MTTCPDSVPARETQEVLILEIRAVSKAFGDFQVLKDISIRLEAGEIVSLLGISGSGKTTLFNIIAGLLRPDTGQIYLKGQDITGQSGHVAYMLQKDLLLRHLTVLDNVALPLLIRGVKKAEARAQAAQLLPEFGLDGCARLYPSDISGGMAQRAAFLRTYLFSREVALLDEPFSALDAITKSQVHRWYLDIMDKLRLSTIFITHDIDEAIKLSNRIYVLGGRPGVILAEVPIDSEIRRQRDFYLQPAFLAYKRRLLELLDEV